VALRRLFFEILQCEIGGGKTGNEMATKGHKGHKKEDFFCVFCVLFCGKNARPLSFAPAFCQKAVVGGRVKSRKPLIFEVFLDFFTFF
jgi:hypothetical protein